MVLQRVRRGTWSRVRRNILFFPENRGQPADLGAKSGSNMLRLIGNQFFYAGHDLVKQSLPFKEGAETC